ncbi:restriction endonuclease subunit S [Streptococcus sobrinus]|uniref:restriction endonuclease subunit S n=1 Tax=Streptococcus sobrinus TaxID=1310 RepID=UPI0002D53097|nr:restriction endonuclease subunit S [Streptococcus sobrinus]
MENQKIPEVRFKEFESDWITTSLGKISNIQRGLTYKPSYIVQNGDKGIRVLRSSNIDEDTFVLSEEDVFVKKDAVKIPFIENGDILVTAANGSNHLVGKHTIVKELTDDTVHGGFMLSVKTENSQFINAWMSSNEYSKILQLVQGGNGAIGNLSRGVLIETKMTIPAELPEQTAIGQLFSTLDDLLSAHKDNLSNYQTFKSTMLSKMFPKHGQTVPEIRLAGFDGEWEEMMLGEHSRIIAGGTPKTKIKDYWNPKEIPWMSSGEINNKFLNFTYDLISKKGLANSSAKWVRKHSVLIALAGQGKTRGTVAVNNIDLTTNQSIAAIEPDASVNYLFLFYELEKRYDELRQISSGDGTRGGLNKKIISEIRVKLPLIEEQQAIGKFFANLDDMILATQSKVDELEILKKKLLQEMFV